MSTPQQILADLEWQYFAGADEAVGEAPGLNKWSANKQRPCTNPDRSSSPALEGGIGVTGSSLNRLLKSAF